MKLNRIAHDGKKVLLISGLIWTLMITLLFMAIFIADLLWWHITPDKTIKWNILVIVIIILIALLVNCVMNPWLKNKQHGYMLQKHQIIVQEGMLFVSLKQIPLFRIQNIDIKEGWLMRKWQLATITLSTAGGNSDIILIDKAKAQQIMQEIKMSTHNLDEEEREAGE